MQKTQFHIHNIKQDKTYQQVLKMQEEAVQSVTNGGLPHLFLVEHPPVFTLGTSANTEDILNAGNIPVIETGRGGQVTYHGPGQLVIYPIINLKNYRQDIRWYIRTLQQWIINILSDFNIHGQITDDVGVWVETPTGPTKIAAIGVRVRKWVTFHGIALNVNPDLSAYNRIIPCGITDKNITSMEKLGQTATIQSVHDALLKHCPF